MSTALFLKGIRPGFPKKTVLLAASILVLTTWPGIMQAAAIIWHSDYGEAVRDSARHQKPMVVVVGAQWCKFCRKMQSETLPNPAVAARISARFVPLLIDADQQPDLVEKLNVAAFPTVLIITPDRRIIGRYAGFQSAAQLDARLASFQPPVYR